MQKRGLFYGKKASTDIYLVIGEAVAAVLIGFILLQVAQFFASGDVVKAQFLVKDAALTLDALIASPYPALTDYQFKGLQSESRLETTTDTVKFIQGVLERTFAFVPDRSVKTRSDAKFDIPAEVDIAFQMGKDADGISIGSAVGISQKEICSSNLIMQNPKIVISTQDSELNSILPSFLPKDIVFTTESSRISELKPDFVIILQKTSDAEFSAFIPFKSKQLSNSRTFACFTKNGLMDGFSANNIVLKPSSDASLDSAASNSAALLINIPESRLREPEAMKKIAESISEAINGVQGR